MDDTLLSALRKRLAQPVDPAAMASPSQDQIAQGLQARTGKAAVDTGGPQASNIGEQATVQAGKTAVAQQNVANQTASDSLSQRVQALANQQTSADTKLAGAKTVAETQMATQANVAGQQRQGGIEQAAATRTANEAATVNALNAKASQTLAKLASDRGVQTADIFASFSQGNADLAQRKDAAQLEQLGFTMAMQDKAYTQQVTNIGAMRQLQTDINFKAESQRLVLGDEMDQFLSSIGFKEAMGADRRTFEHQVASIDIEQALSMAKVANQQANSQAMIGGATGVVAAAPGAIKTYNSLPDGEEESAGTKTPYDAGQRDQSTVGTTYTKAGTTGAT